MVLSSIRFYTAPLVASGLRPWHGGGALRRGRMGSGGVLSRMPFSGAFCIELVAAPSDRGAC